MGKYKILIRKGGNSISGVTEVFDFMLSPNLSFNDMGYYTRFYMYDKKGARIGHIFVICSYQRPGVVNELIDFDAPYKIVEELPSSYATVMDRPDMFFDTKQMSFLLSTLYDMCEKMDSCVIINTKE